MSIEITEVDNSQPSSTVEFAGTPAAVIGTAEAGPAFVPTLSNSESSWAEIHGTISTTYWGSVAVKQWYNEAQANAGLVYLRILGVGDGKKRSAADNSVTNAGFTVGAEQVQTQLAKETALAADGTAVTVGAVGNNPFANEVFLAQASVAATTTLTVRDAGQILTSNQISFITAGGDTVTITGHGSANAMTTTSGASSDGTFNASTESGGTTNNKAQALAIATAINLHEDFTATAVDTAVVTVTQVTKGLAGNTAVTKAVNGGDGNMHDAVLQISPQSTDASISAGAFSGAVAEAQSSAAPGRMYFLSTLMSSSAGSNYLIDAGMAGSRAKYAPILRGAILVASGVELTLSGWNQGEDGAAALTGSAYAWGSNGLSKNSGGHVGAMNGSNYTAKLIFNGLKDSTAALSKRIVTVKFDAEAIDGHLSQLNTDPDKFEELGHYLYANYPVPSILAVPTTDLPVHNFSEVVDGVAVTHYHNVLLTTGSAPYNTYGAAGYKPNFEGFNDRFSTPFTPWVISQAVGGAETKLFRLHGLDDGQGAEDRYFAEISNIQYPTVSGEYAKFNLTVRAYGTADTNQTQPNPDQNTGGTSFPVSYSNLTLDPNSNDYIARRIGDYHRYYNFDVAVDQQKLVLAGTYENQNRFFRVEVSDVVAQGATDPNLVPFGHQGVHHLVTSGTLEMLAPIQTGITSINPDGDAAAIFPTQFGVTSGATWVNNVGQGMITPPVPMRNQIVNSATTTTILPWGMRFDRPVAGTLYSDEAATTTTVSLTGDTAGTTDQVVKNSSSLLWASGMDLIRELNKFYPSYATSPQWVGDNSGTANTTNGSILDSNSFNNNKFSLGKVYVATETVSGIVRPNNNRWHNAYYIGTGTDPSTTGYRFLTAEDLKQTNQTQKYTRFIMPFQGGFDGFNIFNQNKRLMNHHAAHYEQANKAVQGGLNGPTVAAYRKAIDILSEKTDTDINALCIPGQRSTFITDHAAESMEERFDAIYLMDIEVCDQGGSGDSNIMFGDNDEQVVSTFYTLDRFGSRGVDSSFAAAYYPNVNLTFVDNTAGPGLGGGQVSGTATDAPASIAALGAFALTDRREGAWGTPAGYDNGRPKSITNTMVELTAKDVSDLYIARINPIANYNDPNSPTLDSAGDTEVRGTGVIQGQKTLLLADSALSRLDVRKLMVYIRRRTRSIAESYIFQPNQPSTLKDFSAEVEALLSQLQGVQAIEQYRVVIDETTTSQADIENNTVRGKVFVKPYRSIEIISIDINIENNGAF
jgi:hypothetical protein